MANVTAKTSSNIFYKARCEAATHNEQLSSREGAADYMSIDRGRLYRIESGITILIQRKSDLWQIYIMLRNWKITFAGQCVLWDAKCLKLSWQIWTGLQSEHFLFSEKLENKRNASRYHSRWSD